MRSGVFIAMGKLARKGEDIGPETQQDVLHQLCKPRYNCMTTYVHNTLEVKLTVISLIELNTPDDGRH